MAEVWIITGGAGEYSDHYTWCESVWTTEELATAEGERLNAAEEVARARPMHQDWKFYYVNGPFDVDVPARSDASS